MTNRDRKREIERERERDRDIEKERERHASCVKIQLQFLWFCTLLLLRFGLLDTLPLRMTGGADLGLCVRL